MQIRPLVRVATYVVEGIVSTTTQIFSGLKTFLNGIVIGAGSGVRLVDAEDTFSTTIKANQENIDDLDFILPANGGSSGNSLITDGSGNLSWANRLSSAVTSINGDTNSAQSIITGSSGSNFSVNTSGGVSTINLPDAGVSTRGAVTTGTQSFIGLKSFNSGITSTGNSTFNGPSYHLATGSGAGGEASITVNRWSSSDPARIFFRTQGGSWYWAMGMASGSNSYNFRDEISGSNRFVIESNYSGTQVTLKSSGGIQCHKDTQFSERIYSGAVTLTDGATPALNAALGNTFVLTAAGDRTIAIPTNPVAWQRILIVHVASGADRTLALNTGAGGFKFGTNVPSLTATPSGKTDVIGCLYDPTQALWLVLAVEKGV